MTFSKNLEKGLIEVFLERTRTQVLKPFSFKVGGIWFCPSCGNQMLEAEGVVYCPSCKLSLNEFIVQLVELHPHGGN
jgi:rubrerythrin